MENLFYSEKSTKVIINCLLEEDKDFLTRNNIKLTFKGRDHMPNYMQINPNLCNNNFRVIIFETHDQT